MSSLAYGPGGASIAIPTGPAPDYKSLIENDPFYKQQLEFLQGDTATQKARIEQDRALAEQLYNLNVQQANQSLAGMTGPTGDYGLAAAERRAALDREQAAHDVANKAEYNREALASRGMASSGQVGWEAGELGFQSSMLEKQIQADLEARRQSAADAAASAAHARSAAQAGLQLQLQEMAIRHGGSMTGYGRELEDLTSNLAKGTGGAAYDTYQRLLASGALLPPTKMATWDAESGYYIDGEGNYYDASKNKVSYQKPIVQQQPQQQQPQQQQQLPSPPPIDYWEPPPGVPAPPPPVPLYNPIPGQWGYD